MTLSVRRREALWLYILISPWVIGFLAFTAGPLVASLYYSLTHYDIASPSGWVCATISTWCRTTCSGRPSR